ncbi:MAG: phosphoribosylamine--glycine ligase [Oscillospiraceae bacterium]
MKILVVGGGGREHATVKSLLAPDRTIFCAPGNAGIATLATCVDIKTNDISGIVDFAKKEGIDLAIVSQDEPLVLGMVDALEDAGIRAFGPNKAAAIIEGSKAFSKDLMKKYGIPTAAYEKFTQSDLAIEYLEKQNKYPAVIKASGLALGKGVIIAEDFSAAKQAVVEMLDGGKFGDSSSEIIIEEFMTGTEVSVLAFTDGNCVKPMISAKDHKRALDGDKGLNTGGMGVIAPNAAYTKDVEQVSMEKIFLPTIKAMNSEGRTFKGVLYFGLIITDEGPKVIEYNCRLGDPEAQVCLSLLQTDLLTIMEAVIDGTLDKIEVENKAGAGIIVMLCSGGYPESYQKGKEIFGLDSEGQSDKFYYVFHSGTAKKDGKFLSNGGRVLGLCALGENLCDVQEKVYSQMGTVNFENSFYRQDIGGKR